MVAPRVSASAERRAPAQEAARNARLVGASAPHCGPSSARIIVQ
jgi:hypothetical protein